MLLPEQKVTSCQENVTETDFKVWVPLPQPTSGLLIYSNGEGALCQKEFCYTTIGRKACYSTKYCYWLDLSGLKHFTFMSIFEYFDFCDHLTSFFVTIRHTLRSKFRQLFKSPRNSESFGYILAFLTFLTLWPTFFKRSTYVNIWFKILKIVEMA